MAARNVHIVHRRILDISTDSQSVADAFMGQTGEAWAQAAAQVDDALFTVLAPGDDIRLIDRLEVDMGVVPPDLDPDDLAVHYQECLVAALEDADETLPYQAAHGDAQDTDGQDTGAGARQRDLPPSGDSTAPGHTLDAALHFLATGSLPWWMDTGRSAATEGPAATHQAVRKTLMAALRHAVAHEKGRLQDWLNGIGGPNRAIRLCQLQLDAGLADQLASVAIRAQAQTQPPMVHTGGDIKVSAGSSVQQGAAHQAEGGQGPVPASLDASPRPAANIPPHTEPPAKAKPLSVPSPLATQAPARDRHGTEQPKATTARQYEEPKDADSVPEATSANTRAPDWSGRQPAKLSEVAERTPQAHEPTDPPRYPDGDQLQTQGTEDQAAHTPRAKAAATAPSALNHPQADDPHAGRRPAALPPPVEGPASIQPPHRRQTDAVTAPQAAAQTPAHRSVQTPVHGAGLPSGHGLAEQGMFMPVDCAGGVLLAAFLPTFFSRVSLRDEAGWCADDSAVRGAQLVHYLATGASQTPQFALQIPMLMCGVPPETPVPLGLAPNDTEQEAADGLLKAVLSHWTPLSGTSAEGLRETFLMRPGLLKEEEDHWRLRVERGPYDMLLEQLPWSYRTVGLSWMPKFLEVEW